MPTNHEQAVHEFVAAFTSGDVDALLQGFDRYAVVRFDRKWPESRPRFGTDEIRAYFEDVISTIGTGDGVVEEIIEVGDRVVARGRWRFEGQGSGFQDDLQLAQLLTFRQGKIIECEYFLDFNAALEVAGLAE